MRNDIGQRITNLSADALKSLQTAYKQSKRMCALIEDLLLLSQVERLYSVLNQYLTQDNLHSCNQE